MMLLLIGFQGFIEYALLMLVMSAACYICWLIYALKFHPLARYPGPFLASISRFWIALEVLRGNAHKTQAELHQKHGILTCILEFSPCLSDVFYLIPRQAQLYE